ncbi:MAG: carbon starvation protein A [Puniceicoccaceae bacterium]
MLLLVVGLSAVTLILAYWLYGGYLRRIFEIDDRRATPAEMKADGVDYVSASPGVVFGHHFSSIAGAGPIVGPILAALWFGWGPTWVWILVGAIFVGGMHDFGSLMMSLRNGGRSVSSVAEELVGRPTAKLFALFLLFALIYVVVVFLDLTASTFATTPIVATASGWFVLVALGFGYAQLRMNVSLGRAVGIFVPLSFLGLGVGHLLPAPALEKEVWGVLILGYCFLASILPVNVLLQPRDFLSSFFLVAMLGLGLVGLFLSGASVEGAFFKGFSNPAASPAYLFPALFITVACGACSGFHSVVASGTTSKQIRRESDALKVGYGAMLTEGLLAVFAMATVMVLSQGAVEGQTPVAIFSSGASVFLLSLGIPASVGAAFTALVLSTFLLTTLDTCTRLARFLLVELVGCEPGRHRMMGTLVVLLVPGIFIFLEFGGEPAWKVVWPLFGSTNQLIGALTLVTLFVFMRKEKRASAMVGLPMVFMFLTPIVGLGFMVADSQLGLLLRVLAGVMMGLGLVVTLVALRASFQRHSG